MCLYPTIRQNPKYKPNKKNGGIVPPFLDSRTLHVPTKCNKCMECKRQKANEWLVRLTEDIKENTTGKFITLTFSNDNYTKLAEEYPSLKGYALDNQIATRAVRLFNERYRKEHKKAIRHWFVTELGQKGRTQHLHIHGIVWLKTKENWVEEMINIEKHWKYGYVWKWEERNYQKINYVNGNTIGYITKYINKVDEIHKEYKPIVLASDGIGNSYTNNKTHSIKCIDRTIYRTKEGNWELRWYYSKIKHYYRMTYNAKESKFKGANTKEHYKTENGYKLPLPIYWRNKIYNEEEREKLWINKLDKKEIWLCGHKIDISKGHEEYLKALENYRKRNNEWGFGGKPNWKREEYEYQLRIIKQAERKK